MSHASLPRALPRAWCTDDVAPLRAVVLGRPYGPALTRGGTNPYFYGFRSAPSPTATLAEWESFADLLVGNGIAVHVLGWPQPGDGIGGQNWHYPRDLAQTVFDRCFVARPSTAARNEESHRIRAILEEFDIATVTCEPVVEFGDVIWGEGGVVVAGYGPRSSRAGIAALARVLDGVLDCLLTIDLGKLGRDIRFAHLDLCLNVIGRKRAVVYDRILHFPTELWRDGARVSGTLADLLRRAGYRVIPINAKLQGVGATNFLSLDPDSIVASRDAAVGLRNSLASEAIRILEVPGVAMLRTGGGPRCMSMPIVRESNA